MSHPQPNLPDHESRHDLHLDLASPAPTRGPGRASASGGSMSGRTLGVREVLLAMGPSHCAAPPASPTRRAS
ncbi:MAG TPA: hypothetical protein VGP25_18425 [Gemmatimonadaceae bacterium]|nr:hypothetical protein [Gemmatimonadaceae bacterium]